MLVLAVLNAVTESMTYARLGNILTSEIRCVRVCDQVEQHKLFVCCEEP